MRGGTETPRAPALGSRFRGTTMGVWGSERVLMVAGGGPARRDGRFANRPYDGVWERRRCDEGWLWGCPAHAPLGTGFRGTTVAGERAGECCWCRAGVPLWRDGRFANRPYDGVGGRTRAGFLPARERHVREALRQAQGERIRVARLRWGGGDAMGGTETPRAAPRPWVPAFARTTIGIWGLASVAGVGRGCGR